MQTTPNIKANLEWLRSYRQLSIPQVASILGYENAWPKALKAIFSQPAPQFCPRSIESISRALSGPANPYAYTCEPEIFRAHVFQADEETEKITNDHAR